MKKLRLFDSLKFVVAAIVCTLILNVAHAATTTINSVIAYGKTEQNGTPTPTTPVPIMTNNGVLKVNKNLLNPATVGVGFIKENGTLSTSSDPGHSSSRYSDLIPVVKGLSYTFSGNASVGKKKVHGYDANSNWVQMLNEKGVSSQTRYILTTAIPNNVKFIRVSYSSSDTDVKVMEGTSADEVYVDGLTETIRDSAGHTATAQMLLGLNDEYRDEQNINTGAITRKVGVKVLDGTENWGDGTIGYYRITNTTHKPSALAICSHLGGVSTGSIPAVDGRDGTVWLGSDWIGLGFRNLFATVEEFKAWLADQYAAGTPVIVVYPLATETTENVTTQTLTTAPVRQTAGSILGMPIEVVLGDGTREWVSEIITIATTKYNEESFAPVKTDLSAAVNAVEYVVSNTMSQAQAIDDIATNKQTRPDEGCTAKYCLLVEDEDGTPHWYPIAGANGVEYVLPAGYTQLEYLQSDGRSRIIVPYRVNNKTVFYAKYSLATSQTVGIIFGITDAVSANVANNGILRMVGTYNRMGWGNNVSGSVIDVNAPQNLDTWYEVLYDQNKLYQDNVLYATSATSNDTEWVANYDLGIFARNGPAGNTYPAIAKISSVWAKENGVYKINLVPARRDSDGVLGMYDLADANPATAFYTNAGTGEFTAGPDM